MSPSALPTTMRAVHQPDKMSPRLVLVETPLPTPESPHQILVKVMATAPCYSELTWVGQNPQFFPPDKEPVPGQDVAGIVVGQPALPSVFKAGDSVFCRIDATRPGGLCEYTIALELELAHKPASLDWIGAAATPLSALTAWQALFVNGSLDPSALYGNEDVFKQNSTKKVIITAAGGSVGGFAVQFAKLAGAQVTGVCGTDKVQQVTSLGASIVVDYKKQQSLGHWVAQDVTNRQYDLVVDCVGGDTMIGLWAAVKDGGEFISVSDIPDRLRPKACNKTLKKSTFFIVQSLGSELAEIAKLMDQGIVHPLIDSVFEFSDFQKAFDKLDKREAKGKVVIKVEL